MRTMLGLTLGLATFPLTADAQWGVTPDGHNQYTFNYATGMAFGCGPEWAGCSVSGNILSYQSETGSLTFTFAGASGVFTATNVGQQIDLGTIHVTESGAFSFPTIGHPNTIFLTFTLFMNSTIPTPIVAAWAGGYIRDLGIVDGSYITPVGVEYGFTNNFIVPTATPRPPRGSTILIAETGLPPRLPATSGDYTIEAWIGLTPEPSTWMMLGTGLLGLGGVAVGRRRRPA